MHSILVLYRSRPAAGMSRGDWRWRLHDARNHQVIAASSEGYRDRKDALANIARVLGLAPARPLRFGTVFAWPVYTRVVHPLFTPFESLSAASAHTP